MAFDFPASPSNGQQYAPAGGPLYVWDGTKWVSNPSAGVVTVSQPQGRLSFVSGVPVQITNVTGGNTVYYVPYVGQIVPLYNGSKFVPTDIGGQLSQLTTDTTKSPAACVANANYDVFVWLDGSTVRATRGPAWSTPTGPGGGRGAGAGTTELVRVGGVYLNANAITNGPAAQRGTYVGSFRTNASGTLDFIIGGVIATILSPAIISIFNAYNRVRGVFAINDNQANYTIGTGMRSLGNSNNNRISFLRGLDEDQALFLLQIRGQPGNQSFVIASLGFNSTTAGGTSNAGCISSHGIVENLQNASNMSGNAVSHAVVTSAIGWVFMQALEQCGGSNTSLVSLGNYMLFTGIMRW